MYLSSERKAPISTLTKPPSGLGIRLCRKCSGVLTTMTRAKSKIKIGETDKVGQTVNIKEWFSFRNGYDLGNACRLGLPKLSLFQKLILCPITLYGYTAQITCAHGMTPGSKAFPIPTLHGHIISFANVVTQSTTRGVSIPNDDIIKSGGFNVTFAGSKSIWRKLKINLHTTFGEYFCHDHLQVWEWILYLQKLYKCDRNLFPPGLTIADGNLEQLKTFCEDLYRELIDDAISSDDIGLFKVAITTTDDIAQQRTSLGEDLLQEPHQHVRVNGLTPDVNDIPTDIVRSLIIDESTSTTHAVEPLMTTSSDGESLTPYLSCRADKDDSDDQDGLETKFISNGLCHVMCSQAPRNNMDKSGVFKKFHDIVKQSNVLTVLTVKDHENAIRSTEVLSENLTRLLDQNISPLVADRVDVSISNEPSLVHIVSPTLADIIQQQVPTTDEPSLNRIVPQPCDDIIQQQDRPGIKIERWNQTPINEFLFNDKIFFGAFFDIFPLAQGIVTRGSLSPAWRLHFLKLGTQQLAASTSFLFLIFNQMQRHKACSGVSIRAKSNNSTFSLFNELMKRPNLDIELMEAISDPESTKSRKLLHQLLRCTSIASSAVPWGDQSRRRGITTMINEWRYYGCSTFFNTIPWSEVDCPLSMRLALAASSSRRYFCDRDGNERNPKDYRLNEDINELPSSRAERAKIAASNPIPQAMVFDRMNDAVNMQLYGLEVGAHVKKTMTLDEREKAGQNVHGLFGKLLCGEDAHEASGRGTMHTHHTNKSRGLNPDLMQRLVPYPALLAILRHIVDQMFKCEIDPEVIIQAEFDKAVGFETDHPALLDITCAECQVPTKKSSGANKTAFEKRENTSAYQHCRHCHKDSCHKGKSGLKQCRYAFDKALNEKTEAHYIQREVEQKQRHKYELLEKLGDDKRPTCTADICNCMCCPRETDVLDPYAIVQRTSIIETTPASESIVCDGTSGRTFGVQATPIPFEEKRPFHELAILKNIPVAIEGKRPEINICAVDEILLQTHGMTYQEISEKIEGGLPDFLQFKHISRFDILDDNTPIEVLYPIPECQFKEEMKKQLSTKNSKIVEFNDVIAVVCRCNQSIQLLGTSTQVYLMYMQLCNCL